MFKGITFSGHFFEMIIRQLAAGGAAALLADRVNQSQMEELLSAAVSGTADIIPTAGARRGWRNRSGVAVMSRSEAACVDRGAVMVVTDPGMFMCV